MSRRSSKSLEAEWYDLFADWELADQAAALHTLAELHRQAVRQAERKRQEDPTLLVNIFREPEAG